MFNHFKVVLDIAVLCAMLEAEATERLEKCSVKAFYFMSKYAPEMENSTA